MQPPTRARRALRFAERALAVYGLVALLQATSFGFMEVISGSMGPTLVGDGPGNAANDWVLYERLSGSPPKDALVLFRSEDGVTIVKRVSALAGERVRVADGQLEVDGARRENPPGVERYVAMGHLRRGEGEPPFEVPAGQLLVLGDDQKDSWDSRFFGGLPLERVEGRAVAIVWPPSRWRWVW
jgi:signal peptidase I